jgi:ubiquitin C-terminal hydrolase
VSVEKLTDQVNCTKCNGPREHIKSLSVSRLPPILSIQLKRFKQTNNVWRKQRTRVDFPIHNLDLLPYVGEKGMLVDPLVPTTYNLFGVINHHGSLTFGHYISVVKNPYSGKWYTYDDQRRIEIQESQLIKENAYILFYIRSDVNHKDLGDLFP